MAYINGYDNPNRSLNVKTVMDSVGHAKTWSRDKPTWFQTADKMRLVGKILIPLALILAAATAATPVFLHGNLLIGVATAGGVISVATFTGGVVLICKAYWNDPAYRQERREKILSVVIDEGYDVARAKYFNEWNTYQLVSKEELKSAVSTHYKPTYKDKLSDSRNNLSTMIQDGVFQKSDFTEELQKEADALGLLEFIKKYQWKPFADKVLPLSEKIQTEALSYLKTVGFERMLSEHGWHFFEHDLLNAEMFEVKTKFLAWVDKTDFTNLPHEMIQKYDLMPQRWKEKANELANKQKQTEKEYNAFKEKKDRDSFASPNASLYPGSLTTFTGIRIYEDTVKKTEELRKTRTMFQKLEWDSKFKNLNDLWTIHKNENPVHIESN